MSSQNTIKFSMVGFILLVITSSYANESSNHSNFTNRRYVIGVENTSFYPHYTTTKSGKYSGYARDLFDQFEQYAGIQVEYRPMPVDQLFDALISGIVDFKCPDNPGWASHLKREHEVIYSGKVARYVDGVLRKPEDFGNPLADINRLATLKGWTVWDYLKQVKAGQIVIFENKNLRQMIRNVIRNNADGAYYNIVVASHYLDNVRQSPFTLIFDPSLPHTRSTYHLSTLKHQAVIQLFNQFLQDRAQQITKLKAHYAIEDNLDNDSLGIESWKKEWLSRRRPQIQ